MAPLQQPLVVKPGGAQACVKMSLLVPLKATLEIEGGAAILCVRLAFVNVAEHVRGVVDLVALRVAGEQLLQEQFSAALVVDVTVAVALVLKSYGSFVQLVRFRNVIGGLQRRRRHVQIKAISLFGNAVIEL